MSNNWNRFFINFVLLFVVVVSFAQPRTNSPYSRLGLGDLLNQNLASLNGMGDLSATYHDPYHINLLNPASLSYLRATAFEVGARAKYANLNSIQSGQVDVWSGGLAYLSLAFPIINPLSEALERRKSTLDWGMNFALVPYSLVGYNVETVENREGVGQISSTFEGSGGTYRFMWGNGLRYKNISFGVNLGYIFGKLNRDQVVNFDSLQASYSNILHDDISVNGLVWNAGIQYDIDLNKVDWEKDKTVPRETLTIGLYGNADMNVQSKRSQAYQRFNRFYNDLDTIRNEPITTLKAILPAELSAGVMYQKANKLRLGVNYTQSLWSNYENEARPEKLLDAYEISVGGEIIPEYNSYNSYLKKVRYRFGAFYGTDPRSDGFNKQLTSYGITLGLGLPIILQRQGVSFLDVAFEIGRFGSSDALQETFVQMTFGFTLNDDKWFFKRKFN